MKIPLAPRLARLMTQRLFTCQITAIDPRDKLKAKTLCVVSFDRTLAGRA